MVNIRAVANVFWWFFVELMDLAVKVATVPLIGNIFGTPIARIAGWCYQIWEELLYFGAWVDRADRSLLDILSWDSIKSYITATWPMGKLYDILSWDSIKASIDATWPLGKLYDILSWDSIKAAIDAVYAPLDKFDDIFQRLLGLETATGEQGASILDILDPSRWWERTWKAVQEQIEEQAETAAKLAQKILVKIWDAKIWE